MRRKRLHKILSLAAAVLLGACSGDSPVDTSTPAVGTPTTGTPTTGTPTAGATASATAPVTPAQAIATMEARGDIPVLDRSAPLKGVDTNADGIRDDLERFVSGSTDTPSQKASLRQLAKALDITLTVDTANDDALRIASGELTEAINCVWANYSATAAPAKVEELRRLAVNTRERYDSYVRYNQARSGAVIALPSGGTCK